MFKNLGKLDYKYKKKEIKIKLSDLKPKNNFLENFIIYKDDNDLRVYNRKCDHAGGMIISKNEETICPIHFWKFDPSTGYYNNGVKKKEINFSKEKNFLKIKEIFSTPNIKTVKKKLNTKIRFFNHAFLKIIGDNFSFSTDPWAIGPAFNTGWWLKHPTKDDWIEELNQSSFIYISHNHPDHLHPLTLSKVDKNIPIVVANFITKSSEMYMKELGFKNIFKLEFNTQYNLIGTNLYFSLFKSGDFREDSGIYFSNGEFTALLDVDANLINFDRLPNVHFYGSSFAGGASGYPLMFDNFKNEEKIKISLKNKDFLRRKLYEKIKKISPNYFMPYAGFFIEKLKRDKQIFLNNKKNSIGNYLEFCQKNKINLLNVLVDDSYKFLGKKLIEKNNINLKKTKDLSCEKYLQYYKKEFIKIDEEYIKNYFLRSKYQDKLLLYICLTDDHFRPINKNYLINFSTKHISFTKLIKINRDFLNKNINFNKLILKVRHESFLNTIYNKLPWEDLLIGFQCKVLRNPNVYNANFWHHFTNIYTTSINVRSKTNCNSCLTLNQYFDDQIHS